MFKPILLLGTALALSTPAFAAEPINLRCDFETPKKKHIIDFTLNEDQGTAIWQWDDGSQPIKRSAIFSATKVTIGAFTIDRTNLSLERVNDAYSVKSEGYPAVSVGKCEIRKITRAF